MTAIEIRASALSLPAPERAALAHDLIASLDAEDPDPSADALWAAEIERRAHEVADGKVTLIDADEVHAEIGRGLGARTGAEIHTLDTTPDTAWPLHVVRSRLPG